MAIILAKQSSGQRGIGLLELMLAMVIITIVTLISMQYFGSSKRSALINDAINELQAMINTVAAMPNAASFSGNSSALTTDIARSGQIPLTYLYHQQDANYLIATPWGNDVTNAADVSSTFDANIITSTHSQDEVLLITSTGLPNWGCKAIVDYYQAIASYANCDNNNELQLEFPLNTMAF